MCVHSAGATDLSACHRVNGKKKTYFTLCSFLFLSEAQSPLLRSKFPPVPERQCQEWKKGWFSELTDKKGDVITQSEMLLYSLMELEFELPVFAYVGDTSQPRAALARLFISADNGCLSWPRGSPRRVRVRLLRWRCSGRLANPTPALSTCRGPAPLQQSCFFAAQVTQDENVPSHGGNYARVIHSLFGLFSLICPPLLGQIKGSPPAAKVRPLFVFPRILFVFLLISVLAAGFAKTSHSWRLLNVFGEVPYTHVQSCQAVWNANK